MDYPDHLLDVDREVYFDSHDLSVIAEPLRSRIYTMEIRASEEYGKPDALYLVSGRRSPWQQYLLRVGRCGPDRAFDPTCKGSPTTALPYHSHHQQGTAVDMGGVAMSWFRAQLYDYGLALTVPGEDWHAEVTGPTRVGVIPYPGGEVIDPPTLPEEDLMDDATLFELIGGAVRPAVRLAKITGDGRDEAFVTDGGSFARRVGPKSAKFLTDHFNVGNVIELPLADAAVIGDLYRLYLMDTGRTVPAGFDAGNPSTWP